MEPPRHLLCCERRGGAHVPVEEPRNAMTNCAAASTARDGPAQGTRGQRAVSARRAGGGGDAGANEIPPDPPVHPLGPPGGAAGPRSSGHHVGDGRDATTTHGRHLLGVALRAGDDRDGLRSRRRGRPGSPRGGHGGAGAPGLPPRVHDAALPAAVRTRGVAGTQGNRARTLSAVSLSRVGAGRSGTSF